MCSLKTPPVAFYSTGGEKSDSMVCGVECMGRQYPTRSLRSLKTPGCESRQGEKNDSVRQVNLRGLSCLHTIPRVFGGFGFFAHLIVFHVIGG